MFRSQYALLAKKLIQMEEVVDKAKRENERLKREVQSKVRDPWGLGWGM